MSSPLENELRPEPMPEMARAHKFSEPPMPISEDEQRRYDEIHEKIVERLKQTKKGRRSRWQPPK